MKINEIFNVFSEIIKNIIIWQENINYDWLTKITTLFTILGVAFSIFIYLINEMTKFFSKINGKIRGNVRYRIFVKTRVYSTEKVRLKIFNYCLVLFEPIWITILILFAVLAWGIPYAFIYVQKVIVLIILVIITIFTYTLAWKKYKKIPIWLYCCIIYLITLIGCSIYEKMIAINSFGIVPRSCIGILAMVLIGLFTKKFLVKGELYSYNRATRTLVIMSIAVISIYSMNFVIRLIQTSDILNIIIYFIWEIIILNLYLAFNYKRNKIIVTINKNEKLNELKTQKDVIILGGGFCRFTDLDDDKITLLSKNVEIIMYEEMKIKKSSKKGICYLNGGKSIEFNRKRLLKDEWIKFSLYCDDKIIVKIVNIEYIDKIIEKSIGSEFTIYKKLKGKIWNKI